MNRLFPRIFLSLTLSFGAVAMSGCAGVLGTQVQQSNNLVGSTYVLGDNFSFQSGYQFVSEQTVLFVARDNAEYEWVEAYKADYLVTGDEVTISYRDGSGSRTLTIDGDTLVDEDGTIYEKEF